MRSILVEGKRSREEKETADGVASVEENRQKNVLTPGVGVFFMGMGVGMGNGFGYGGQTQGESSTRAEKEEKTVQC